MANKKLVIAVLFTFIFLALICYLSISNYKTNSDSIALWLSILTWFTSAVVLFTIFYILYSNQNGMVQNVLGNEGFLGKIGQFLSKNPEVEEAAVLL